ncbi:EAL domain-containing protein [Pontibacillus yanchengensis]|uniref:EAL domain-containing protein n=2 Tax=Pontibacillus yanchengensis TaxID=462910 RepID=A0ACC7VDE1_9BACI|nr:EAL domain-containing protein [Pontibacillus yanchengensis]MYL34809.1 EAL domain-containing protein [Pontibacillus yanchengensis]MYL52204.1 EAL domain-containing protein [Pontibacillus yanchengensis]
MDPLDIIAQIEKTKPAYQPIFSAIKHDIIGYEVLGRIKVGEEWESLGTFFQDPQVPDDFKLELDEHLLKLALQEVVDNEDKTSCLFINRNARQLMLNGEKLIETLTSFVEQGFSYNRIVLEITEHDFEEDFESLSHLLLYYKTYGIQIAIDQVGAKSSNLDYIRQLEPHILKIDSKILRDMNSSGFQDILYSLSMLARRIGAAMLFENVEDSFQLYYAWKHGGRFYQGYYLEHPSFSFLNPFAKEGLLKDQVNAFIRREKGLIEDRLAFVLKWDQRTRGLLDHWDGPKKVDSFIEKVCRYFDEESFRIYVCDSNGQQISSNYRKYHEDWIKESEILGTNWAFRPYFLENMVQMRMWNKGRLSDLYSDIDTREMVRTFSFPLSAHHYIFIDIQYSYIYEHECLLI